MFLQLLLSDCYSVSNAYTVTLKKSQLFIWLLWARHFCSFFHACDICVHDKAKCPALCVDNISSELPQQDIPLP